MPLKRLNTFPVAHSVKSSSRLTADHQSSTFPKIWQLMIECQINSFVWIQTIYVLSVKHCLKSLRNVRSSRIPSRKCQPAYNTGLTWDISVLQADPTNEEGGQPFTRRK